jgi:hypothetical protein
MRYIFSRILLFLCICHAPLSAEEYVVVVNSDTPLVVGEQPEVLARQLYLKDKRDWSEGVASKPFGPKKGSPMYYAFLNNVLEMTEAQLAMHWMALKQKSGETPPREVRSDRILKRLISKYQGSFGVLRKSQVTTSDPKLQVLFSFSD